MWQQLKCSLFYIVQIEGICISSIKFVHVLTKFKSSSSFLQTFFLCKRLLTFEVFLPSLLIPDKPNITDTYTSGIWTTYAASKILCDYKRKNSHVVVYSDDLNEQECNFSFETLRGCWLFLRHLYVQGFQLKPVTSSLPPPIGLLTASCQLSLCTVSHVWLHFGSQLPSYCTIISCSWKKLLKPLYMYSITWV